MPNLKHRHMTKAFDKFYGDAYLDNDPRLQAGPGDWPDSSAVFRPIPGGSLCGCPPGLDFGFTAADYCPARPASRAANEAEISRPDWSNVGSKVEMSETLAMDDP
jgi:hypothetical protein